MTFAWLKRRILALTQRSRVRNSGKSCGVTEVSRILTFSRLRVETSTMSEQPKNPQSAGHFHTSGTELPEKRNTKMTQNALEYTVETKRSKVEYLERKLWRVVRSAEALDPKLCTANVLTELIVAS